ncbi:MAG: helix-turn-helix transcriptional regulator [Microbacterium sp.]
MSVSDRRQADAAERGDDGLPFAPDLQRAIDEIIECYQRGDYRALLTLLRVYSIEVWLGLRIDRLRGMLQHVAATGGEEGREAQHLCDTVWGDSATGARSMISALCPQDPRLEKLWQVNELWMSGRSVDAVALLDPPRLAAHPVAATLDPFTGWNLICMNQYGMVHMLSNDPAASLIYFTAAQLQPVQPTLASLTRSAYVKHALVHALFGDREASRRSLVRANAIARTSSWMEPSLDAESVLAMAVLEEHSVDESVEMIDSIPLSDIGTSWSYYMVAMVRILLRAGMMEDTLERLKELQAVGFPGEPGCGLEGSIFPVMHCYTRLRLGEFDGVSALLDQADPDCPLTICARGQVAIVQGEFRHAMEYAVQLEKVSDGLAQMRSAARSIAASAHVGLGNDTEAIRVLELLASTLDSYSMQYLGVLSAEARAFAQSRVDGWQSLDQSLPPSARTQPLIRLTRREAQVLALLATDATRAEIAEEMFISVNTLKSNIATLYRKLSAATRDEALENAYRIGLLGDAAGVVMRRDAARTATG